MSRERRQAINFRIPNGLSNGHDFTEKPGSCRPTSITSCHVAEIKAHLDMDRLISIREISDRVDCSIITVHNIISNTLYIRGVCTRWIPTILSDTEKEQKAVRCNRFANWFEQEGDALPQRIVTIDEAFFLLYVMQTKEWSTMWGKTKQRNKQIRLTIAQESWKSVPLRISRYSLSSLMPWS